MWDEDDKFFKGFTQEQLQKPEQVKYKKTGGRKKGKGGPGPVDKAVGNWLTWRSERRANRQRLIDEQEAQSKAWRQGNRNWILRGDRDVTWQSPAIDPRITKRTETRNLRTARKEFAKLTSEQKLNLNLQDTSSNALTQASETSGVKTNKTPESLVNKDQKLFSQTGDISFNTDSKITKGDIPEALREQLESGKTPEGIKPTDPKPTGKKSWIEGPAGKALATLAILGAHGNPSQQMGIAKQFSSEDRSTPAYDPKASTKPKTAAWDEDLYDIYGLG